MAVGVSQNRRPRDWRETRKGHFDEQVQNPPDAIAPFLRAAVELPHRHIRRREG